MPGRLEFEHEVENEAEMPVKDMEFGLVFKYDGDRQPEAKPSIVKPADDEEEDDEAEEAKEADTEDVDVKKEVEADDEDADEEGKPSADTINGTGSKEKKKRKGKEKATVDDAEAEESVSEQIIEVEDEDELEVKLALLDIYFSKLDKREEAKDLLFDRGLTEYKRVSRGSRTLNHHAANGPVRFKQMRERDPKMRGSLYIATRYLRNSKQPRTTRRWLKV